MENEIVSNPSGDDAIIFINLYHYNVSSFSFQKRFIHYVQIE